jgi:outer membrane translocation and assembly module TamA
VPAGSPLLAVQSDARFTSGQAGVRALLELERTDGKGAPRRGYRFRAEASGYPVAWDVGDAFGRAAAQVSGYVPLIGELHLATRLGGMGVFGAAPIFESAFIGGRHSLRGFRSDRFAGDAAVYGGAELRLPLGTLPLLVNGEVGVFGLADAARVWHDGDSPGGWHTGVGGGAWFGVFGRAVSAAYAHGERGRFYVWAGLPF